MGPAIGSNDLKGFDFSLENKKYERNAILLWRMSRVLGFALRFQSYLPLTIN